VKNVTVSLDDAIYRQARRRAAEADRSLSSVVREFLQEYGAEEGEFDRLARREKELRAELDARPVPFNGGDRLTREQLYDPDRVRDERQSYWRENQRAPK
jgi:hypothetical protein